MQNPAAIIVGNANVLGTETFDARPTGSGGFTTDYGTGGIITGTYSSGLVVSPADQYGGAGGTGNYANAVGGTSGYSISLATNGVPGVNYFGYWLSALDGGNQAVFYRGGVEVGSYTPPDLVAAVGACNGANAYCGNPNAPFLGNDSGEPFAFVNFVDTSGYFDEVRIFESPSVGNYELDNHTVRLLLQRDVLHLRPPRSGAGLAGAARHRPARPGRGAPPEGLTSAQSATAGSRRPRAPLSIRPPLGLSSCGRTRWGPNSAGPTEVLHG